VLHSIPFDTVKSSIAIFMAEVLGRSLQEETADPRMFHFLQDCVLRLDAETGPCTNFHLVFLLQLSVFLGCVPALDDAVDRPYFDLREGVACDAPPLHPDYLEGTLKDTLVRLADLDMGDHAKLSIPNEHRRTLLRALIDYYRWHLQGMHEIRSHLVLEEVMA
jgi:DNA repair protein RecO (recombination protein O)